MSSHVTLQVVWVIPLMPSPGFAHMAPLIWDGWPGSTLPASLIGLAVSAGCQVGFLGPLPHGLLVSSWPGRLPYTLSEGKDAKLLTAFPQRSHSITSTNFYWSKEVRGPRYG